MIFLCDNMNLLINYVWTVLLHFKVVIRISKQSCKLVKMGSSIVIRSSFLSYSMWLGCTSDLVIVFIIF